jgi:hypothetical protein
MSKEIIYTESKELYDLASELKKRYYSLIDYVQLDCIFFAFVGGDYRPFFKYEIQGLKNEWVKFTNKSSLDVVKTYSIGMTYDFYEKSKGPHLQWILLDLLYSCDFTMNGKLKSKDVHEFSLFLNTLEDLGVNHNWRDNYYLPDLLGEETIIFGVQNEPL